jgi:hypothetical protein
MPIYVNCQNGHALTFPDEAGGRRGKCSICECKVAIPRFGPRDRTGWRLLRAGLMVFLCLGIVGGGVGAYFHFQKQFRSLNQEGKAKESPPPKIVGFDGAPLIVFSQGSAIQQGNLQMAEDVDTYRFVAPLTGIMTVKSKSLSDKENEYRLTAYEADQKKELPKEPAAGAAPVRDLKFRVTAGRPYFLRIAASTNPGGYELNLATVVDDFGNHFETAQLITLSALGTTSQKGQIDFPGDEDMFRFVPTSSGTMTIQVEGSGSGLDTELTVYDDGRKQIAENDDDFGLNSRVHVSVVKDRAYFVKVGCHRGGDADRFGKSSETGTYLLTLRMDDFSDSFRDAHLILISPLGYAVQKGRIEHSGDQDVFWFLSPRTGKMTIRQNADVNSNLSCASTVYDDKFTIIATDQTLFNNNKVEFNVLKDKKYYVKVAGFVDRSGKMSHRETGNYVLQIDVGPEDDFGNTFATAGFIFMSMTGGGFQKGRIDYPLDVDMFRFVATVTGKMTVRQQAAKGSKLDSSLTVYNHLQTEIAHNDDEVEDKVFDSKVQFDVTKGQVYYIKAAGFEETVGEYTISIATELIPVKPALNAAPLPAIAIKLKRFGSQTETGRINASGEARKFRFVALTNGRATVRMTATGASQLDSLLTAWSDTGRLLAANDNEANGILNSRITFPVVAGKTYELRASASEDAATRERQTGDFALTVSTAPIPPKEPEDWEKLLTYVPEDTGALFGINLARFFSHPAVVSVLEDMGVEVFDIMKFALGVEIQELEYGLIGLKWKVGKNLEDKLEPQSGVIVFRANEKLDAEAIDRAWDVGPPIQKDGKTYYRSGRKSEIPTLLYHPTDQIAVIGLVADDNVSAILRKPTDQPVLTPGTMAALRRVGKADAWLTLPDICLKKLAKEMGDDAKFKLLTETLEKSKTLWLSSRLDADEVKTTGEFEYADADTAKQLSTGFKAQWKSLRESIEEDVIAKQPLGRRAVLRELVESLVIEEDGRFIRVSARFSYNSLRSLIKQEKLK